MTATRVPFLSLSSEQAEALLAECGASARHAGRLRRRILAGADPEHDPHPGFQLPAGARAALAERTEWLSLRSERRVAAPDGSEKHLLRLADGEAVEAVRLPGKVAGSACLSSQVGCGVACRFCASGLDGVRRNLAAHEILEQVALLRRHGPVQRLVFMGAGEPTHNLREIAAALPVLRDEAELGPRYVLISTVGPAPAIDRLAGLGLKFTLALSLHALDPALRGELIPTQRGVDPLGLLDAADRYRAATGRSYQVEYVLLSGVNDGRADARELARALRGRRGHVSLIAWNPVPGMPFERPAQAAVRAFLEVLHEEGTSVTLRNTVGEEATAACGQLRASAAATEV